MSRKKNKLEYGLKTISKRITYKQFAIVKNIVYDGIENVYDLCIPETHNFIAEGQVVHNCNLSSIALPKFVKYDEHNKPYFDFEHLREVSEYLIEPMNNVIDFNHYPVPETEKSNMLHRPIGVGCSRSC
jgi:hypothetical protein